MAPAPGGSGGGDRIRTARCGSSGKLTDKRGNKTRSLQVGSTSTCFKDKNPPHHRRHRLVRQCRAAALPRLPTSPRSASSAATRRSRRTCASRSSNDKVKFYIGDVREYDSVHDAMHGVDYVFHAAALKQVPSCEFYPMEAVRTNVLGAENVMRAAIEHGRTRCVVLSTDKAVYPDQRHGHVEGDDGKGDGRQVAPVRSPAGRSSARRATAT